MTGSRRFEDWRDEVVGTVKLAVPMATADARRCVNAVLSVLEAEHMSGDDGSGSYPPNPVTDRPCSRWRRFVSPWERVG